MSGRAVLAVWDREDRVVRDLVVTWEAGHDVDARIAVPKKWEALWRAAVEILRRDGGARPYAQLPGGRVPAGALTRSATGFYATAVEIFGREARWRVHPPTPESSNREPPGVE